MQTIIQSRLLTGLRYCMQVTLLSITCGFAFVGQLTAQDLVSDCRSSIGFGYNKCSDHEFLNSLFDLKFFDHQNFDEVRDAIRCLDKEDGITKYYTPRDCGKMYDKFVKDVTVTFEEKGWIWKSYDFRSISFKIIGGRDVFDNLISYLNDVVEFSMIKDNTGSLVTCEKGKIWKSEVYEYEKSLMDTFFSSCEGDAVECLLNGKGRSYVETVDNTPIGLDCNAKGFFQDGRGSEASLYIRYNELDDFDFKNTTITYWPQEKYTD